MKQPEIFVCFLLEHITPTQHILSNMRSGGETVQLQYPPGDLDELIFAWEEYAESDK